MSNTDAQPQPTQPLSTQPQPTQPQPPRPLPDLPRHTAQMTELVFPKDTNHHGTAFGGWVLALMDKISSVAAVRHARSGVVTARMEAVDFHVPIRVGDALMLDARVIRVGRTSMTVEVLVYREVMASGERQLATSGRFVFVAIDDVGKPHPVPPLPATASAEGAAQ